MSLKHYDYDGLYSVKFKILYTSLIIYFLIQNTLAKTYTFQIFMHKILYLMFGLWF